MATAKAWTFTARGKPADVLKLTDIPLPTLPPPLPLPKPAPTPEEWITISVSCTALNPGSQFHMGIIPLFLRASPATPEMELSGTITDVWSPDSEIPTRLKKGDEVVAFIPFGYMLPTGVGALCSHLAIPARFAVKKPQNASMEEAAGLLQVAGVALKQVELANLKAGDRALVYGASGGIGTMTVQMAKKIVGENGTVVAVCSARNAELVKSLGADEVVDYQKTKSIVNQLTTLYANKKFNAILDCHGHQQVYTHCAQYLTEKGFYVSAGGVKINNWNWPTFLRTACTIALNMLWPTTTYLGGTGRTLKSLTVMDYSIQEKERLVGMVEGGEVRVVVDSVWSAEEALRGYEILSAARARGKIIIKW
ncbi:Zinc-type alcohol dehydrogenase-like protein [Drechslerella dactyloides]|uniref:Zinc-type alcohol dehydrogenase-like protein n=1 Tax=Drechslerella dactyloides TaxID=74499 RepID=A0AAD6NFJ6_DREDA|nr:Zinc-type alcohol dehydrogenase-like protein [Drechslerella dactyloides]